MLPLKFGYGKKCRHVKKDNAEEVIAGYTIGNDISVRDWQMRVPTFTDSNGISKFTVTQGNEYLIDNVILELNNKPKNDTFWTSYWAALTFRASNEPQ